MSGCLNRVLRLGFRLDIQEELTAASGGAWMLDIGSVRPRQALEGGFEQRNSSSLGATDNQIGTGFKTWPNRGASRA